MDRRPVPILSLKCLLVNISAERHRLFILKHELKDEYSFQTFDDYTGFQNIRTIMEDLRHSSL